MRARGECVWKFVTLDIETFETTNFRLLNLQIVFLEHYIDN